MNSRAVLGVLGVLNLALAGTVAWLWTHPASQSAPMDRAAPPAESKAPAPSAASINSPGPTPTSRKEPQFTWKAVADRDLKGFIAKLRGVKCPEETIQDIILAEVDRIYQAKEAALGVRKDLIKPWETTESNPVADVEKRGRLRQLRVEKRNLIYELLGIDVPGEIPSLVGSNFNTAWEQALALLPIEKRGPVRAVQDRFWELSETLRKRTDGYLLPEEAEEYRRLRTERVEGMRKILTAEEFDQVELRTSTTGNNLRTELGAFEPSEAEFKAVFKVRRDLHEATYLPGQLVGTDPAETGASAAQATARAEEQLKSTLGEARYAEYQRSQDPNFQQIHRIVQDAGLSRDAAILAYQAQQETQARIQKEVQNASLPAEQRRQLIQKLQADSMELVRQAVGDAAFQQLQQRLPGRFRIPGTPRVQNAPVDSNIRLQNLAPAP